MPKIARPKKRFFSRIHPSVPFIIAILALAYIGLNIWIYFNGTNIFNFSLKLKNAAGTVSLVKNQDASFGALPASSPSPSPRPVLALPSGRQEYTLSHGKNVTGPKIQTVTIDPLDPQNGTTQIITLKIESVSPLKSAAIIVATDNREKTLDLKLTAGDSLKGTYAGSWQFDDTYNTKYSFRYLLKAESGTYDNTMYLR